MRNNKSWTSKLALILLSLTLSYGAQAQGLAKLIASAADHSGAIFAKLGLKQATEVELINSLKLAVKAMSKDAATTSEDAVKLLFREDAALVAILAKDAKDITKEDISKFANAAASTAERLQAASKGNRAYVACSRCVDPELIKLGITFVTQPASEALSGALAKNMPRAAREADIVKISRSLNIKGLKNEMTAINDTELAQLNVALERTQSGNSDQKALGKAIAAFTKDDSGKAGGYLDTELYTLMSEDLSPADQQKLTALFERINGDNRDVSARYKALNKWFVESADTPELQEALAALRKCYQNLFKKG